ncbi:MAG: hypothetical protein F6K28_42445 [Microcoleus sp. SIO2G3]|nr:hypothetical protein [Microcoleus sp. SIO2G3]
MASKDELQTLLKEKYGINKNISQALDKDECERLLSALENEPSIAKLARSFTEKNASLGSNNAYYSRMRNQAEKRFETLKVEYRELEESIAQLETSTTALESRKRQLELEQKQLELEIQNLSARNDGLETKVKKLASEKEELIEVNDDLKKENKALKNIIDEIRLKLAINVKKMLQLEDSEIRKALIKLFKSTQG